LLAGGKVGEKRGFSEEGEEEGVREAKKGKGDGVLVDIQREVTSNSEAGLSEQSCKDQ
jgi:hypothetical protein